MTDEQKTKEQLIAEVATLREQLAGQPARGATGSLFEREGRFPLAVQTNPDTIVLTRLADGQILDVNEGFVRNTGYSREEVAGKSTRDLMMWVNAAERELFIQTLRDKGECRNFEATFRESANRIITGRVSAQIIDVDGEAAVFSIVRDISDLKQAQEALRESEEHFRAVVESLNEGLIITDADDLVRYVNSRMTELTGYTSHDLVGRRAYEVLAQPDQWLEIQERNRQRMRGHAETYELKIYRRDGSSFWAEVHASPYRNASGEIIGTLGALTDISERRQLESQLRQSQKMEAVGQLAAGIAHNFNNMLQATMGSLALALEDVQGDVKSHLLDAEESSRRGAAIVKQLMLFARRGRRADFRPVDLSRILADTVELCGKSFDRRIEMSLHGAETPAKVNGDSGQLQQMFLNICLNARDALEGVIGRDPALQVSLGGPHLREESGHPCFEIRITDNGAGMGQEVREQIFEPFFSTKEVGSGTGLGLATAFAIVDQHKGSVECESELDVGTTFIVRLPVAEASVDGDRDTASEPTPHGTETILVIDDEPTIRKSLDLYLTKLGYRVLLAENGTAGLELYKKDENQVDLVLLDLSMPHMSGQEVLRTLRSLNPDVKVIIFTGYPLRGEEFEVTPPVLLKPVNFAVVARRVRDVLDGVGE